MQSIVDKIEQTRVYQVMDKTPLTFLAQLSERFDNQFYLKREDLTPVKSFKLRGAYQKISGLSAAQKKQGIIAPSAGNHAQGVAMSAQVLKIDAIIVMPKSTPKIKVVAVRRLGAEVILHGSVYDEAFEHAKDLAKKQNLIFIHPYDDRDVIAGQGSIAPELLEQLSEIDYIFLPVGGGGLITGIGAYIKTYQPQIKIIGVESDESPTLKSSLENEKQIKLPEVGLFADGVAVKQLGNESYRLARQIIDDSVLVSNDEICAAIKDIFEDVRCIAEPSGALATAGMKRYVRTHQLSNKRIISMLSGANVNFDRLRHIAERAELGEENEAIIAVTIPEEIGSFLRFCQLLGNRVITEFNYRFADSKKAHIFVGVSLERGNAEKTELIEILQKHYTVVDMSDNEMAKTHVRYMVGGKAKIDNEVVYRFIFPEKPGALLKFLLKISTQWNISLFHYRNHGADFGRVLVGFQVTDGIKALEERFDDIGYAYHCESDNIAYRHFLSG